jgi:hypothetical protein
VVGALAGIVPYWGQTGFTVPKNSQETAALVGSALIFGLGYIANKPGKAPVGEQRVTEKEPLRANG